MFDLQAVKFACRAKKIMGCERALIEATSTTEWVRNLQRLSCPLLLIGA